MKNTNNFLAGLITITVVGGLAVGGFTLLNIESPNFFPKIFEPQRPLTEAEKRDNSDLASKSSGDKAIDDKEYLNAIHHYSGISDNSNVVDDKEQLIESAKKEYLSYIIAEIDYEIENSNYTKAKSLIAEALNEIPENSMLLEKQKYVSAREELHSLTEKNESKDVIAYINSNENIFGNDKTVSEIYSQAKDNYLSDVVSDSNQKIESHEYDKARTDISSAKKLIGKNKRLTEQSRNIDEKEVSYNISVYRDNEDWYGMYKYINSLKDTLKNDNLSTLKDAKNKMINIAISESDNYLNDREYNSAKKVLSGLKKKIGKDEKINEQSKKIDKTIVEDKISDLKAENAWREIIEFLNTSPLKKEFKTDYSNAYSNYKSEILQKAREYLQNDSEENVTQAYDLLLTAEDILKDDDEYIELCKECEKSEL